MDVLGWLTDKAGVAREHGRVSHSVRSNSLRPHGLQAARLLCPWHSPDKNAGVGCHFLLQGIFLTPDRESLSECQTRKGIILAFLHSFSSNLWTAHTLLGCWATRAVDTEPWLRTTLLAFLSSCLVYHWNKWSRASSTSAGLAWNPGMIPSPPVLSHLLLAVLKAIQLTQVIFAYIILI